MLELSSLCKHERTDNETAEMPLDLRKPEIFFRDFDKSHSEIKQWYSDNSKYYTTTPVIASVIKQENCYLTPHGHTKHNTSVI